jgi:hypothetical protein
VTTQEIVQEWCERHAEHKSIPGTKFVSGRILCSREDVLELVNKAALLALHVKGLAKTPHCQECLVPWPCPTVRTLEGSHDRN